MQLLRYWYERGGVMQSRTIRVKVESTASVACVKKRKTVGDWTESCRTPLYRFNRTMTDYNRRDKMVRKET